ncbi:hypothetical protein SLNWT_1574 [Streptomyces albus]|uniref:Lipoprotein n=1 Tax=Streptomyces albus (strain ATCC 21838 / DSM 41398 / FERM P-419 / JCM 4703 / NBRC 107858) TaxID=1081613 RepID=A0A0B5ERP2_STRA4|nr:hypothetical protein SLNWT_1574 [Streptomyces albus]AOU76267.1 hypothetical protein SLNHY_1576 [Streptomyces albus]AYN32054.1 hypothetical protein DUI70_1551 [Streptomyces albus]
MPHPESSPARPGQPSAAGPGPGRRSLLVCAGGTGLLLLAGCSTGSGTEKGRAADADQRARARAARDSALLLDQYDAVIAAHPQLTARLTPLRTEVARHVTAFGGGAHAGAEAATPHPSAAMGSPSPGADVPEKEADALAFLARNEKTLTERREAALTAAPGETARLLASVAACGAVHTYFLTTRTS